MRFRKLRSSTGRCIFFVARTNCKDRPCCCKSLLQRLIMIVSSRFIACAVPRHPIGQPRSRKHYYPTQCEHVILPTTESLASRKPPIILFASGFTSVGSPPGPRKTPKTLLFRTPNCNSQVFQQLLLPRMLSPQDLLKSSSLLARGPDIFRRVSRLWKLECAFLPIINRLTRYVP